MTKTNIELMKFERDLLKVLKKHNYYSKLDEGKVKSIIINIIAFGVPKVKINYYIK